MGKFWDLIFHKFLGKLLFPARGESLKVYGKGVLVALVIFALLFYFLLLSDIKNYHSFGQKLGTYKVVKGGDITVASNELDISFHGIVISKYDSIFYYPEFYIYSKNGNFGDKFSRYDIGRRTFVATKYFNYMVELKSIKVMTKDTVAYFDVFRKDLPMLSP